MQVKDTLTPSRTHKLADWHFTLNYESFYSKFYEEVKWNLRCLCKLTWNVLRGGWYHTQLWTSEMCALGRDFVPLWQQLFIGLKHNIDTFFVISFDLFFDLILFIVSADFVIELWKQKMKEIIFLQKNLNRAIYLRNNENSIIFLIQFFSRSFWCGFWLPTMNS